MTEPRPATAPPPPAGQAPGHASGHATGGHGFGTAPVFLASISTILGAVLFLRFGYAVAHAGVLSTLLIILLGHAVTIPTALAIAEIATNRRVEGGGEYFIISRSFGTTIGADHVIDYTRDDFGLMGRCQDVIVDTAGNRRLSDVRRALAPRGTLVIVGGEGGGRWLGGTGRLLRALLLSPFVPHRLRPLIATERREDLLFLTQLIESGRLAPVIDRTYSLGEVPAAIRYLAAGRARGKVVIRVTSDGPSAPD